MSLIEAQRILDREARRLLDEQLGGESLDPPSGSDPDLSDGGPDQTPLRLKRKPIPVGNADRQSRVQAA